MPSSVPDLELSPFSLTILCDVASSPKLRRRFDRIDTLLKATEITVNSKKGRSVPGCVLALEKAGLVEIRRATQSKEPGSTPGWSIEITDKGLTIHRCLMATLRNAGALTAQ